MSPKVYHSRVLTTTYRLWFGSFQPCCMELVPSILTSKVYKLCTLDRLLIVSDLTLWGEWHTVSDHPVLTQRSLMSQLGRGPYSIDNGSAFYFRSSTTQEIFAMSVAEVSKPPTRDRPISSRVVLVPWDPESAEHVKRLCNQRVACGWNSDKVERWKVMQREGKKAIHWIVSWIHNITSSQ